MEFLKKYKIEIGIFFLLTIIFFATRIFRLGSLPIFTDEAIYLRWAQIAKNDANWRFISLTDGKQPLFIWFIMVFMRFIKDPLIAGRMVSVIAGFFSMVGIIFLGREIFKNRWIGILSGILYLIFPMALVYDRMALYDTLVGTFAVWSLYFGILLVRRLSLDKAFILGLVAGGGALTKTSGFFNIYLLPFLLLIFDYSKKERTLRFFRFLGLCLISCVLVALYYSILRLSPFFHIIDEKDALFVYPFREWLLHPLRFLIGNFFGLLNWFVIYITVPLLVLIPLSFAISFKYTKEKLLLIIWFSAPFFALALFGKALFPRFIFFMTLSLLPLIAYSLFYIKEKIKNPLFFVVCLLFFILPVFSEYKILTDFQNAPIPTIDLNQYSNDWPAGGGVKEAVAYFKDQAATKKIYIATQGTFGLMPYSLELYLVDNPNIIIHGFWPVAENRPKELVEAAKIMPVYVVFYQPCRECSGLGFAPSSWNMELVAVYKKPNKNNLTIYKLKL